MVDQRGSSVYRHSQPAATSRVVSPVIIEELHLVSIPNSEFEENTIAENVVSRLGLGVGRSVEHRNDFTVVNRTLVKPLIESACPVHRAIDSPRSTAYALSFGPVFVYSQWADFASLRQ